MYNVLIRRKNGQKLNMDEEGNRLLAEVLAELKKSGNDASAPGAAKAIKDANAYSMAQNRGTKATDSNTKSTDQATTASGAAAKGLYKMSTGAADATRTFVEAASSVRENRENFESLNPAIKLTGNTVSMVGKGAGLAADALGDAIPLIGGFVSAGGKLAAAIGQAAGEIINTVGPLLTAELQRASEAFRAAGSVGALGADGLSGLANHSI